MSVKTKTTGKNCVICQEICKRGQSTIKCTLCNKLVHAIKSCSLLTTENYNILKNKRKWVCPNCTADNFPFKDLSDNDLFFLNNISLLNTSNLNLIPDENFQTFINECKFLDLNNLYIHSEEDIEFYININSKYHDIHELNNIKCDIKSTLGICHTNIASLSKNIDELRLTFSLLKKEFQIIGITEHKIRKDCNPSTNIDIDGYKPFIYDPTETSHGGTVFLSNSLNHNKRDDLKFNSRGDYESTFIEIILPNKKNLVVGCIYRHPSSPISINDFNDNIIEPVLNKITNEDKLCALIGDFNIDLLKSDVHEDINNFYNTMTSYFFAPYIMQPTRPSSKTLIDNIFVNSIDYNSHSGNLTIQLSDHLFQFV